MVETQTLRANGAAQPVTQQAVHFAFYKLRPSWWQLQASDRRRLGEGLLALLRRWDERLLLVSYSLVGLRSDCDFMLWKAAESIDELHELGLEIAASGIGPYLEVTHAYLSLTKRSIYVREHQHEGQEASRLRIAPVGARYLFVYPFVKTREWYVLPAERRQEMMNEHIRIGHKYPRVRINTTYSFGLDDQDFVLAFESDHPSDFLDLVMELRGSEASQYTQRDTPMYTCTKVEGDAFLRSLGI
ncbi:MAG TPA: chlorite dismutase family protein [Dehalococcoidia bacterium]|nr:chlorite dismutase family protein [Dehalococcoidia bacterium]